MFAETPTDDWTLPVLAIFSRARWRDGKKTNPALPPSRPAGRSRAAEIGRENADFSPRAPYESALIRRLVTIRQQRAAHRRRAGGAARGGGAQLPQRARVCFCTSAAAFRAVGRGGGRWDGCRAMVRGPRWRQPCSRANALSSCEPRAHSLTDDDNRVRWTGTLLDRRRSHPPRFRSSRTTSRIAVGDARLTQHAFFLEPGRKKKKEKKEISRRSLVSGTPPSRKHPVGGSSEIPSRKRRLHHRCPRPRRPSIATRRDEIAREVSRRSVCHGRFFPHCREED